MNRDPNRRVPPKRTGFDPAQYDPSKYDMYAAFRTKERAEERAAKQAQRRSLYDVGSRQDPTSAAQPQNRKQPQQNRQTQGQNRTAGTGVYHINRPAQPTKKDNQISGQRGTGQPRGTYTQKTRPQPQTQKNIRQTPAGTQKKTKRNASGSGSASASAPVFGTRVNSSGEDAYRYGFHSSYRTSDGRILDGFDKAGRPIYREDSAAGSAPVVRMTAASPDAAHLHPVRRIRVETLEDTERKPFPFALVLTVFLCTALVMAVLYTYMTLNECTNSLSTLTYRLSSLRAEVNTLSAEVVRREDLIAIEQTAADELGMVKNDVLEKRYVSIENEDKTEVVKKTAPGAKRRVSVEIDLDTGLPAKNAGEDQTENG